LIFSGLPSVQFDDEFRGGAEEINDIRSDGLLPAEAQLIHLLASKYRPKLSFNACRILA